MNKENEYAYSKDVVKSSRYCYNPQPDLLGH